MSRTGFLPGRPSSGTRRWFLWGVLVVLIAALLAMLVWLAGRYEESQVQDRLERDALDATGDIRSALTRNVQSLQALQSRNTAPGPGWGLDAEALLRQRRELLRLEWRDTGLTMLAHTDSPFRPPVFDRLGRGNTQADVQLACNSARRGSGVVYTPSYFVPQDDGLGLEVMDLCLPLSVAGATTGFVVATYSLNDILAEMVSPPLARSLEVSFTEADGTRLAFHGMARRGNRAYTASQLLDLPGQTLVLRLDSWRGLPNLFPNFLTAMVAAMTLALASVLVLLGRDARRRLRAEQRLAEALAFRKAMEDSLVAGLRARDLQGRTTYVNPAFCQMVGFSAQQLQQPLVVPPYWPPDLADEYLQRQSLRQAGASVPPREGAESIFMRKDGSRFPVLIFEAPLINAQGVQTGWMSAFLDISEQRRVEELSRATQERLQATARLASVGEMASLLSHELNQPLAAISSYATGSLNMLQHDWQEQLVSGYALPESAGAHMSAELDLASERNQLLEEAMRQIAEQAQRAGKVVKSVHDFVRRREQAREAVAPLLVLEAIMPLVGLQARKQGVRIQTLVEDGLPRVWCDRTMVEQVLLNLARNAMQAMDATPQRERLLVLQIRAPSPGSARPPEGVQSFLGRPGERPERAATSDRTSHMVGWLEFSVADAGTGISAEVAGHLFTPFFTTKAEGMGLGLSLCRTVVEQHGGFLEFTPNQPRGTVFRFTLPLAPDLSSKPWGQEPTRRLPPRNL